MSTASLSEVEKGKYKAGIELLENLVKKYNVNLHFVKSIQSPDDDGRGPDLKRNQR